MIHFKDSKGDLWSVLPEKIVAIHWGKNHGEEDEDCSDIYLEGGILIQIYASDECNRKGLSITFGGDWPVPLYNNEINRKKTK